MCVWGGYQKLGKIKCALKSVSSLKGSERIEIHLRVLKSGNTKSYLK